QDKGDEAYAKPGRAGSPCTSGFGMARRSVLAVVTDAGAAKATGEGSGSWLDHQGMTGFLDATTHGGERQADDKQAGTDNRCADQQRPSDQQITHDGEGLWRLDGVHRITADILMRRLGMRWHRQQASGKGQDNGSGAKQFHDVILHLGATGRFIFVLVTIAAASACRS